MKKNWTMKVAALMLALTMITACFVGSTFAKYVTRAQGEANARVAKWGVLLTMEGDDLFKTEYVADDDTFTGDPDHNPDKLTVRADASVADENIGLVAPGTTNDGFKATIVGTPEVAVRYTLHIDAGWKDVVLPHGEYTDFTHLAQNEDGEWGYFDTFTLENDYAPVKWDITVAKNGGTPISLVEFAREYNLALAEQMGMTEDGFSAHDAKTIVETYATQLQDLILVMINGTGEAGASNAQFVINDDDSIDLSIDFDPNRSLGFEFGLKWTWAYEQVTFADPDNPTDEELEELALYDAADTWLGNYAAYMKFQECQDYAAEFDASGATYEIALSFVASATQID